MSPDIKSYIEELQVVNGLSKYSRIVQGIIRAIDDEIIGQGDILPSVSSLQQELGFARDTILKAYAELRERGIVRSKNRVGYFVANTETKRSLQIMLLMYAFNTVQRTFYNQFKMALGDNVRVDTYFHHNNINVFETLLNENRGHYGLYVVAPIHSERSRDLLKLIPHNRLLIVDRHEDLGPEYSFVTQLFRESLKKNLLYLLDKIREFDQMIFLYRDDTDYPPMVHSSFLEFLSEYNLKGRVERMYMPGSLKVGTIYFTISDTDLWELLKDCNKMNLKVGKDIGILSQDETPVKEIICGGITTISADFPYMAQKAADFVHHRTRIREIVPTSLTRRNSL